MKTAKTTDSPVKEPKSFTFRATEVAEGFITVTALSQEEAREKIEAGEAVFDVQNSKFTRLEFACREEI